jgi:ribosomal protein S18 acetylase RimI-like enzyme
MHVSKMLLEPSGLLDSPFACRLIAKMQIHLVESKQDLKEFVDLPYRIYKNDSEWVAPLRDEQWAQFNEKSNPILNHCETAIFLAKADGIAVGRVAAFIDHLAVNYWKQPIGLFGSYECTRDRKISNALLATAEEWLKNRHMKYMRGPWSFASQEWGLVKEGFSPSPVIMAPYNPSWYNDHMEDFGLVKIKDLLVYYIDAREGYQIPERILTLTDKIQKRYGIHVRPINMKQLEKDVMTIVDLSNQCIADNWGYYPVTLEEGKALARDMKQIVDPKALLIAEDATGKPIGFAMTLPDINTLIKGFNGYLFPFGIIKLFFGLPKIRQYRMWGLGVIPEYQGKAIDTLLYRATYEALYSPTVRLEINYVLEDNDRMNNALAKLGVKSLRRYRIYQKPI